MSCGTRLPMLCELRIVNFALIESQSIAFGEGLNVITGETGAGKSTILQALQFLLGGRSRESVIRSGAEEAVVEGLFNLNSLPEAVLRELPEMVRGPEIAITRAVSMGGRSKVYMNGRMATLGLLEEVADKLVNVCGQNHHVRLLEPKFHLDLVDGYAGLESELSEFRDLYQRWRDTLRRAEEAQLAAARQSQRGDELSETIKELQAVQLKPGLRNDMEGALRRLANAEKIVQAGQELDGALEALFEQLSGINVSAHEIVKLDPTFADLYGRLSSARIELDDFRAGLMHYISRVELDDSQLNRLRDRVSELARLERKYRTTCDGLIEVLRAAQDELGGLQGGVDADELASLGEELHSEVLRRAAALSSRRDVAAGELCSQVERGLADLSMANCRLLAQRQETELGPHGRDRLEFLIATNPGEPLRPLRHIASGGELSRITLVLKEALREKTGVNVLVFDEVDSGVSGSVARAIGEKLCALGRFSQVICITHLPQIASLADHHFLVGKELHDRATSTIKKISGDGKVEEIARMLAGYKITKAAIESARELLSSKS